MLGLSYPSNQYYWSKPVLVNIVPSLVLHSAEDSTTRGLKYATLSYCWGPETGIQATTKTTTSSIAGRIRAIDLKKCRNPFKMQSGSTECCLSAIFGLICCVFFKMIRLISKMNSKIWPESTRMRTSQNVLSRRGEWCIFQRASPYHSTIKLHHTLHFAYYRQFVLQPSSTLRPTKSPACKGQCLYILLRSTYGKNNTLFHPRSLYMPFRNYCS